MHCNTKTENGRQSFHDDTYFPLIVVTTGIATKENKHANNFNHPSFNRQSRQNRHDHGHLRRDDPHAQSTQLRGRTSSVLRDAQLHGTLQPPLCLGRHAGCFLANLTSPTALLDVPIGTLGTLVFIIISRWLAKLVQPKWAKFAIMGILFALSMFTIAGELTILTKVPFWPTYATIALGEAISMAVGGVVMMILTRFVDLDK